MIRTRSAWYGSASRLDTFTAIRSPGRAENQST
jgi:hypothetical protein